MDEVPPQVQRYPTKEGREALAARLRLKIDPFSQDWEWEVADSAHFEEWLAAYKQEELSDDERVSLMEMLVQCVDDMVPAYSPPTEVEALPAWQAVAALLRANPRIHASTIAYWAQFGSDDPEEQFRVSCPMRGVWASVRASWELPAP